MKQLSLHRFAILFALIAVLLGFGQLIRVSFPVGLDHEWETPGIKPYLELEKQCGTHLREPAESDPACGCANEIGLINGAQDAFWLLNLSFILDHLSVYVLVPGFLFGSLGLGLDIWLKQRSVRKGSWRLRRLN